MTGSRLRRNLVWMAAAQVSIFILQFGSSVILARLLSPLEMGVAALAIAVAGTLGLIQALGLSSIIVREEHLTEQKVATILSLNIGVSFVTSLGIVILAFAGGAALGHPGVRQALLVLAVVPLLDIFYFLPAANLERNGRFRAIAFITTLRTIVISVTSVTLAVKGLSFMSVPYAAVLGQGAAAVCATFIGRSYLRFRLELTEFRWASRYAIQLLAVTGVAELGRRLIEMILARLQGLSALGLYNRAVSLNGLLWDRVHIALARVLLSDFAAHKRSGASLRPRYLRALELTTALLWPAFAGLAVLSGPFILLIYGEKWVPAAAPLALLALSSLILVGISMTWEVFVASGELRTQTRIEFIRVGAAVALFALGASISLTAAAASRVADALLAIMLYHPHLRRMTETTLADFLRIYWRSGVLTLLAIAPGAALMLAYEGSARTPLPLVGGAIVLGIGLWIIGLVVTRHALLIEALHGIRRLRASRRGDVKVEELGVD